MLLLARIEFTKLKRCNVYFVGIVTLLFAPLISVFKQMSLNEPIPHYGFYNLVMIQFGTICACSCLLP